MTSPWDENALLRHKQVLEGKDISFSRLLSPIILELIENFKDIKTYTALDLGCGTGILTNILSYKVKRIIGIDPSAKSIEIAEKYCTDRENLSFECTTIENFTSVEKFQLVISHMTFQAINDIEKAFQLVAGLLTEQGRFIFSIPHPCFWTFYKSEILNSGYSYKINKAYEILFTISNDREALPSKVPYFHRSLESYSMALMKTKLCTERLLEPFPDKKMLEDYQSNWDYPRYIVFQCFKMPKE